MVLHVTVPDALTCCAATKFAEQLSASGPYASADAVLDAARRIWWQETGIMGWLEAFAAHPRIGDVEGLKQKFGAFGSLSSAEQAAALASHNDLVFQELAECNQQYEQRFGHIFIICASGKSASEMLQVLRERLPNMPHVELVNAAREQMKITELRLVKLLEQQQAAVATGSVSASLSSPAERAAWRAGQLAAHLVPAPAAGGDQKLVSPITTHVLDSALGCPAKGLPLALYKLCPGAQDVWDCVAGGVTDEDGRVPNLLPASDYIAPGRYQMRFQTAPYLEACRRQHPAFYHQVPFYPSVVVDFEIAPGMVHQHFHIPLLLSPYSYSTYRGS